MFAESILEGRKGGRKGGRREGRRARTPGSPRMHVLKFPLVPSGGKNKLEGGEILSKVQRLEMWVHAGGL